MTSISKAAAEYSKLEDMLTLFREVIDGKHGEDCLLVWSRDDFKAGAEWRDKQILECPEVMAMREALEFNAWRWEVYLKYHPEAKNDVLKDETLKREKAAYEALAAFDALKKGE